ncbi:MAG: PAS domain-containing protein [Spirochaeta sp.]|jgi:PAS domain S-box-containing protein|nr:PAS domain-containing protein [Spirochaeta sp.]
MIESAKKRILLVEDEALIALAKRQVLTSAGYEVTVAHTGEKALEIFSGSLIPDLVLMDIDLGPGIDGTEAAAMIVKNHDLPIVFLSSHTEKEYTDRAEQITSYGYVVKDSSNTVLLASIKMAFRLHDAANALRRNEAELQEAQQMALLGRWDYRHRHDDLQWNPMIYRIFEIDETAFEATYGAFLAAIHPEDRETVNTAWQKSLQDQQPYEIEHRLLMDDGRIKWVRENCRTDFDETGQPIHSIGIVQDITARQEIQQRLTEQTVRLNDVMENMLDLVAITDMDGSFLFAGRSHERLGYPVSSLVGRNVMDYVHPDDLAYVVQEFATFVQSKRDSTVEYRYRRADGSYAWLETKARLLDGNDTTPPRILFNTREITERRNLTHKHLALADAAFTLQTCTAETINYTDIAQTAQYISGATFAALNIFHSNQESFTTQAIAGLSEHIQRASALLGFSIIGRTWSYDPAREAALGENRTTVFPSLGALASGSFSASIADKITQAFHLREVVIIRIATTTGILGDFTLFFAEENHLQSKDLVETYSSMVGIALERITTEQQNARLIQEKETLLREVQHRIKNNIHTMTSLLSLHADTVTDAAASTAIRDAESRLRSMQVLYDQLYRSTSQEGGSLVTYLQSLVRQIVDLFPTGNEVAASVASPSERCEESLTMSAKQLSTVGLIVNELVTNAMKYAFPASRSAGGGGTEAPAIHVSVDCPDGAVTISVEDNGTGLPETFDPENPAGFGLVLVNAMVEQLEGTLRYESGPATGSAGTRVVVRFAPDISPSPP